MGRVYGRLTGAMRTDDKPIAEPVAKAVGKKTAKTTAGYCLLGFVTAVSLSLAGQQAIAQTVPSITYPVLSAGSTGDTVSRLQATLKLLGFYQGSVDGTYNASTQTAVTQFQTAAGLSADGITGPSTWQKLLPSPSDISNTAIVEPVATTPQPAEGPAAEQPAEQPAEPAATQPAEEPAAPTGPPILRPDVEGGAVAQLQRELQQLGYYDGDIDGIYGEQTQAAVISFQTDQQLEADAIVGPSTWDALTRALN